MAETANHSLAQIRPMLSFVPGSGIRWTGWTLAIVTFASRSGPSKFASPATRLAVVSFAPGTGSYGRFVG
jgi:hypothetical protein